MREVAPVLISKWGGQFWSVESESDELKKHLDRDAGIDFYHRRSQGGLRALASRIQLPDRKGRGYSTFTVRMRRDSGTKTEYAKRLDAIHSGGVYPHWTVQGYVTDRTPRGRLIEFAICRTEVLIRKVEAMHFYNRRTNNAEFAAIHWGNWCEMIYRETVKLPVWCNPNPGPCTYCGNETYHEDDRSSRYICDKCGLFFNSLKQNSLAVSNHGRGG